MMTWRRDDFDKQHDFREVDCFSIRCGKTHFQLNNIRWNQEMREWTGTQLNQRNPYSNA